MSNLKFQQERNRALTLASRSISMEELQRGILPMSDAAIELSGLIMGCRKLVRGKPQDQFLRPELVGEDERIAQWENKLTQAAAHYRNGIVSLKRPLALCYQWRLAIQHYLATGDRGELERLAFDGKDWRDAWGDVEIDLGGRPGGITQWRYWLACRWRDYEAERPKASPGVVRTALVAEIQQGAADADKLEALHSLRGIETPPESGYAPPEAVSRYRRELFKAAGFERRRKQNDS